jgi:outer membrane lipoprotein carrier protein
MRARKRKRRVDSDGAWGLPGRDRVRCCVDRSIVRWGGVWLAAVLGGTVLLACGDGDAARGGGASDTVAEAPFGPREGLPGDALPGEGQPGAMPAPDDGRAGDSPVGTGDDAVSDAPGAATPAPSRPSTPPAATAPAGQQTVSTDVILRATARTYEGVRSLQAEFEQQMRNPLLGQTTRSSGTLYQRQPDRFLMQFSDPEGDVIVSDGEHFWLYYPSVDARQVIRTPRGPQGLDLQSQFIGDPVRRFEATSHGREAVRGRDAHVLTLVPREPLGYRTLKVWIDVQDHLVRRFELTEENGNLRQFELRNVVVNPSLPDRLFQFTPPAGAQVIQR